MGFQNVALVDLLVRERQRQLRADSNRLEWGDRPDADERRATRWPGLRPAWTSGANRSVHTSGEAGA